MIRRQLREAEGEIGAASARLAGLLNLDPVAHLQTPPGKIEPLYFVDEEADPEILINMAINSRPELTARIAAIQVAETLVRQERARPWLPLLAIGYSSGFFGGGSSQVRDDFSPLTGRSDLSVVAVWTFQNLGVGNHAGEFGNRERSSVKPKQPTKQRSIRFGEVIEAQAAARTAARQVTAARSALTDADEGFKLEAERIKRGQGRPIEALDSFRQLNDARQELLRAIVVYDVAQFQLLVALGNNPVPALSASGQAHR